jgi:hypothetical protein
MNYYVTRNGQTYGPYPEDVVRKYVSEGSMLATDLARTESMSNLVPLGQLLSKDQPAPLPHVPESVSPPVPPTTPAAAPAHRTLMNYYVARNGQTYGPYSEETVRKYLSEGSMQTGDMGRTDAMPNWAPLSQILGPAPGAPSPAYSAPPPAYNPQQFSGPAAAGTNSPPSLHWAIVLVIAAFTSGLFITIWGFIEANWIRTIDPASKAVRDLAIGVFFPIIGLVIFVIMLFAGGAASQLDSPSVALVGSIATGALILSALGLVGCIFTIKAFFGMRDSMERHYNTVEPINLRLSGVMTFFFNVLYFQYHMSRIADWKRTGVLHS